MIIKITVEIDGHVFSIREKDIGDSCGQYWEFFDKTEDGLPDCMQTAIDFANTHPSKE